jgi:hypothetical protein
VLPPPPPPASPSGSADGVKRAVGVSDPPPSHPPAVGETLRDAPNAKEAVGEDRIVSVCVTLGSPEG